VKKLDLKKELKPFYAPRANTVEMVDVPAFQFIMLDGRIEAGMSPDKSPEFQEAFGAIYGTAYTLKFMSKLREKSAIDYPVMALEGLWWTDSGALDMSHREPWYWTLLVLQPDHITPAMFRAAMEKVAEKRPNPSLAKLRLERFREGRCVQALHVGPYADEARTIALMEAFAAEQGYQLHGKHHEIYLGDPRRAKPEKLKTVLRHPVKRVG
jgi:hypothetical protein